MIESKSRMIRLELLHAVGAIERAALLARGSEVEADVSRLLETARATVDLEMTRATIDLTKDN
jgi:hypothetical protein